MYDHLTTRSSGKGSALPEPRRPREVRATPSAARDGSDNGRVWTRDIVVFDDDPTGCQSVSAGVVVTSPAVQELRWGLEAAAQRQGPMFLWTNTRGRDLKAAQRVTFQFGVRVFEALHNRPSAAELISRGDSTLRGHTVDEVRALTRARQHVFGAGYDAILFAPQYFEAGRWTSGDIHWASVDGRPVPVGDTEFARDATFGFRSSNLREYVVEKSAPQVTLSEVGTISLHDIRDGGPYGVRQKLASATNGRWVVVNAESYSDLLTVVEGVRLAQNDGQSLLYRGGPSLVTALAGPQERPGLTSGVLDQMLDRRRWGLVVVGSHVSLTNRQVSELRRSGRLRVVEVDPVALLDASSGAVYAARVSEEVVTGLQRATVLCVTGRSVLSAGGGAKDLALSRKISIALSGVIRQAVRGEPAWVLAKGGITSYDIAVHGLGLKRASIVGDLFPGLVCVLRVEKGTVMRRSIPYVVFPGNAGGEESLTMAVRRLDGCEGNPC